MANTYELHCVGLEPAPFIVVVAELPVAAIAGRVGRRRLGRRFLAGLGEMEATVVISACTHLKVLLSVAQLGGLSPNRYS